MNLEKTENTFVLGIFTALVGLLAAVLLAFFAKITAQPIAEANAANAMQSLKAVLPEFNRTAAITIDEIDFCGAFADKKLVAIAASTVSKGYGGDIKTLVGLNPDGTVRTVVITENNETPGLGSNVCERKIKKTLSSLFKKSDNNSALPPNKILDYYSGKSLSPNDPAWKVAKDGGDCPYITGATVSSRAVAEAVYKVLSVYTQNCEKLASFFNSAVQEVK